MAQQLTSPHEKLAFPLTHSDRVNVLINGNLLQFLEFTEQPILNVSLNSGVLVRTPLMGVSPFSGILASLKYIYASRPEQTYY